MTTIPQGLLLLANMGNWLTGSRLEYKTPHKQGANRFTAAALLLAEGKVHRTHERGHYLVESQHPDIKEMYQVCVLEGEIECSCEDCTISPLNPLGLCIHVIACGYDYDIMQTLGVRYVVNEAIPLTHLMYQAGMANSYAQGRRIIIQGCVKLDGQVVRNPQLVIQPPNEPMILEVGKYERLELVQE